MSQPHPNARIFVDAPLSEQALVPLSKPQTHYLTRVLRLQENNPVLLFNTRDGEWQARLAGTGGKQAQAIAEKQTRPQAAEPDIWLLFAPIKFGKIDFLAQKATELGVAELFPVRTRRTVVTRLNDERMEANLIEAAEQSERLTVPRLHAFQPLSALLTAWDPERILIYCDETHHGTPPTTLLPAFKGRKLAVLIGPEGGFAPEELQQLRALPYTQAMSLGPRILRADTAALAALTCVMAITEW